MVPLVHGLVLLVPVAVGWIDAGHPGGCGDGPWDGRVGSVGRVALVRCLVLSVHC